MCAEENCTGSPRPCSNFAHLGLKTRTGEIGMQHQRAQDHGQRFGFPHSRVNAAIGCNNFGGINATISIYSPRGSKHKTYAGQKVVRQIKKHQCVVALDSILVLGQEVSPLHVLENGR